MKFISSLKDSYLRGELIFAIDTVLSLAASLLAIFGVKGLVGVPFFSRLIVLYLTVAVVGSLILFVLTRTFRIIIRHLSVRDVIPFALVSVGKGILLILAILIAGLYSKTALLVAAIDILLTAAFLLGVRVCMILVYDRISKHQKTRYNQQQVLVYGTSDKSVATIKRLRHSTHYNVCGFLERSRRSGKYILDRLPVFSFVDDRKLDRLILDRNIDAILATFGVKKLVLFDNGETAMHNLRLELEDKFKGLDFVPVIGDVRHPERLDFAFRSWHPQVVFHAAAYKHVPLMEENPCEAVLVNVFGTRNVADKCLEYGVE